jgi:hypothetical protein
VLGALSTGQTVDLLAPAMPVGGLRSVYPPAALFHDR